MENSVKEKIENLISAHDLDEARKSQGTDEDILIVSF